MTLNSNYIISFTNKNNIIYSNKFTIFQTNHKNYNNLSIIFSNPNNNIEKSVQMSNNNFYVYNNNNILKSQYSSLFKAISATKSLGVNSYVKNSSNIIVFTRTNTKTTYYRYQFMNYYGSTNNQSTANNWIQGYNYSHVIYGDGTFYKSRNHILFGTPATWNVKPNEGSYFFKKSISSINGYDKIGCNVLLSQTKVRKSQNSNQIFIPYVFLAYTNTYGTLEAGILFNTNTNNWTVYTKKIGTTFMQSHGTICNTSYFNNEYTATSDLKISLAVSTGQFIVYVKNINSGVIIQKTIADNNIKINQGIPYNFSITESYVPNLNIEKTQDLRSMGYFKGLKFKNQYLVTLSGINKIFNTTNNNVDTIFIYNNDCGEANTTNNTDSANIYYNRNQ